MSFAQAFRIVLLLIVVALLAWLVSRPSREPEIVDAALPDALQGQPDLYMLDAQITQYTEQGLVKYTLESAHVRHFETDGITRLEEPQLLLLTGLGQLTADTEPGGAQETSQSVVNSPWQVASDQGFIRREPDPDGNIEEVVFLRSNVLLRQRMINGRFLTLRAPSLYVYPDRQFAQTSDSVMIDTEGGRTTGTGLAVNLAASTLKVFSKAPARVQTIILPDQFK